jgi:hypothetical protein
VTCKLNRYYANLWIELASQLIRLNLFKYSGGSQQHPLVFDIDRVLTSLLNSEHIAFLNGMRYTLTSRVTENCYIDTTPMVKTEPLSNT